MKPEHFSLCMPLAGNTTDKCLMREQDKKGTILTCIFREYDTKRTTLVQDLAGSYDRDGIYVS
jgi:hypothetical protein